MRDCGERWEHCYCALVPSDTEHDKRCPKAVRKEPKKEPKK